MDNMTSIIAIGLVICYSLLLLFLIVKRATKSANIKIGELTVLIPFKNDADDLVKLLDDLVALDFCGMQVSVICVNDHSSDDWQSKIHSLMLDIEFMSLPNHLKGKKEAVNYGMDRAKTEWVLTLDCDVELAEEFFNHLSNGVADTAQFCLIPVRAKLGIGFVRGFFDLEFLALHFIGLKAAQAGKPLLSNAACLLINRAAYMSTVSNRSDWHIPSGDDIFAMFAIARSYGSKAIQTLNNDITVIGRVDFSNDFSNLWRQRLRWIGKSSRVKDRWFSLVSILTLSFNMVCIITMIALFTDAVSSGMLAFLFLCFLVQSLFLFRVVNVLQRTDLLKWIIPSVFIYPFYLLALVIAQIFWKPNWK